METTKKLNYGKTHRSPGNEGIIEGIYVMSVDADATEGRMAINCSSVGMSANMTIRLAPDGLRALAADLIAAADFIDENAAQRAVDDLTNTENA